MVTEPAEHRPLSDEIHEMFKDEAFGACQWEEAERLIAELVKRHVDPLREALRVSGLAHGATRITLANLRDTRPAEWRRIPGIRARLDNLERMATEFEQRNADARGS